VVHEFLDFPQITRVSGLIFFCLLVMAMIITLAMDYLVLVLVAAQFFRNLSCVVPSVVSLGVVAHQRGDSSLGGVFGWLLSEGVFILVNWLGFLWFDLLESAGDHLLVEVGELVLDKVLVALDVGVANSFLVVTHLTPEVLSVVAIGEHY
jgi:hypothetical protein